LLAEYGYYSREKILVVMFFDLNGKTALITGASWGG